MGNRSKGIVMSYANRVINMLCGLILSSFLLRILGDTEYGIYQTIASFVNYLVLLEFGMGTAMTRNISMCRGRGATEEEIFRNASTIWTLTWILSGLILVLSTLFYHLAPMLYAKSMTVEQIAYGQRMIIPITGYLVASFLIQTMDGLLLAYEQYSFASVREIARTVVKFTVLLLLLTHYRYAILIAVADMLLSIVCVAVSYRVCAGKMGRRLKIGTLDRNVVAASLPLCMALFLQAIVNQANNNVDKFLIGIKMSPESVSLYAVALYIYSMFSSLTTIPITMFAPSVAQRVGKGDRGPQLMDCLVGPCRLTALIGGLILFGFAAVGRPFVTLMYGQAYLQAWPIAIILMAPMYINMVNGVLVNVLDALNKRMSRSFALILTTAGNIILTVFWLDRWGVTGAAMATALCTVLGQVLIMNIYYSRVLKIPVIRLFGQAFKGILPYLLIGCAVASVLSSVIANAWISLLAGGFVFVGIVCGGWYLFGSTGAEKAMVRKLLRRGGRLD